MHEYVTRFVCCITHRRALITLVNETVWLRAVVEERLDPAAVS
jgi:hypothetical protein